MNREWKVGDVAHIAVDGGGATAIWTGEFWAWVPTDHRGPYDGVAHCYASIPARPLVVIDAEHREQVERLLRGYGILVSDSSVAVMQAALREFANPTPPKSEEPKGLGAVVEAVCGCQNEARHFVRHGEVDPNDPWEARCGWHTWDNFRSARVLSEGVTP